MNIRNTLRSRRVAQKFSVLLCLAALLAWSTGCEDAKIVDNGKTANNSPNSNNNAPANLEPDESGHGPDENTTFIPAGNMEGSWRLEAAEDQSFISNIDINQSGTDSALTGYFKMGSLVGNGADKAGGDLMDGSKIEGDTLVLKWNPTPDPDEVYTLQATRQSADAFQGTLTAKIYEDLDQQVNFTRIPVPPYDDGSDGPSASDIDAGGQGGAGGD